MLVTVYNKTPNEVSTHYSGVLVRIPGTQSESKEFKDPKTGKPVIVTRFEPGLCQVGDKCRDALMKKGADLYGKITDDYGEACDSLGIETANKRTVDSGLQDRITELEAEVEALKSAAAPKDDETILKQFEVIDEHMTEAQVVGAIRLITAGEVVMSIKGRKKDAQKKLKDLLV